MSNLAHAFIARYLATVAVVASLADPLAPSVAAAEPAAAPAEPAETPTTTTTPTLRMSLDVDPADFIAYHGWGVYVGIRPEATGPYRFRIGAHGATLPSFAVETNDNNMGWTEHINIALTAAVDRNFGSGRGGFFAGALTGWSSLTFTAPSGGKVDVRAAVIGAEAGYRWFPFKGVGLTLTPHIAAMVPIYTSNDAKVGMQTYDQFPLIPVAQVYLGYELDVLH
jgi:hypothetical protein